MRHSKHLDRVGRAEQQRACPVCGEVKTLRGLYGHLMMKHGKDGSELADLASGAVVDPENDCDETFDLIFRYLRLWRLYDLVDEMSDYQCFESEETYAYLRKSIDSKTVDLLDRLAAKGIVFTSIEENMENISKLSSISHDLRT